MQCHPNREDAKRYFICRWARLRAWYIAGTREVEGKETCVYAGFKTACDKSAWRQLYEKQDIDAMVDCLHQIPVKQGQMILIPAGMPHCVGPGRLFLEYHECNDVDDPSRTQHQRQWLSATRKCSMVLARMPALDMFDYTTYDDAQILERSPMEGALSWNKMSSTRWALWSNLNRTIHSAYSWWRSPANIQCLSLTDTGCAVCGWRRCEAMLVRSFNTPDPRSRRFNSGSLQRRTRSWWRQAHHWHSNH